MKYRIKNEKLAELVYAVFDEEDVQRMIECQIYDGLNNIAFSSSERSDYYTKLRPECEYLKNIGCGYVSIFIEKKEIEQIPEYNPNGWNKYPEVEPPREGWYLVSWVTDGKPAFYIFFWDKGSPWKGGGYAFRELPEPYKPEEQ